MESVRHISNPPSKDVNDILSMCALFERDFSIDWIVELTKLKISQILFALEEGIQQGWLIRKGPGLFCFKDSKVRQEWEKSLSSEEKHRIHRNIAALLLKDLPEDDHKAILIAYHLLNITNEDEGCAHLMEAGNIHLKLFHFKEALACYSKVLEDLSHRQEEGEADRLFIKAAIKFSKISTARHDTTKVLSVLQEAMARAKKINNPSYQALLEMHLAKNEWLCSEYSSAMKHFQQGWSMAKGLGDPVLIRSATTFSTFFLYWQGRFLEAVRSYEKSVPDVEKYPQGRFPLMAALTVGHCYSLVGQVSQGVGMMDAIRKQCLERGDTSLAAHSGILIGAAMIDIGHIHEALQYLECSMKEVSEETHSWTQILGRVMLALGYYIKGDYDRSVSNLNEYLDRSSEVKVKVQPYPYLMELCWAMEEGILSRVPGLSLEGEVKRMLEEENIFTKGVAYRYQAMLQKKENRPLEVIPLLQLSLKWLEESGHVFELAKSQLELARQYLALGDEEKAKGLTLSASKNLSSFDKTLIPDDLRGLIKKTAHEENLLGHILELGRTVVTIRDYKDLVQHIISTVNKITGAERGAIFLLEDVGDHHKLQLRASKNLTSKGIALPGFADSMKMIQEVALSGKGRISGMTSVDYSDPLSSEHIRSRICVPMILRDKVVGVLYHDNRVLWSAFKESDLELLDYFAGMAALALDNARAYEEIKHLNEKLLGEKLYYEEQHLQTLHFGEIVGESPAIKHMLAQVDQVAGTDSNVLILGETGVGKELVARAIHRQSPRCNKPFIRVCCSVFPESLISSELFGHEKGAFTGAISRRIGRFELAHEGTLFLDEIGDLPIEIQVRLLRVLQSKEFERIGGCETLYSDFRLVAATNHNLQEEVSNGHFRRDLYYRLNVFPITIPPLRERKEDIPLLAHFFLETYATRMGKTFEGIPRAEMEKLIQYDWPGNVRELENIIERGVILSKAPHFRVPELGSYPSGSLQSNSEVTLADNERKHILWALHKTGWKVRGEGGAAELLKIHPSTLAFRMKKLGIQRPGGRRRRERVMTAI